MPTTGATIFRGRYRFDHLELLDRLDGRAKIGDVHGVIVIINTVENEGVRTFTLDPATANPPRQPRLELCGCKTPGASCANE